MLVRPIHRGGESDAGLVSHRDDDKLASQQQQRHTSKRWLHYNVTSKPTPANVRERNIAVTSYYNQTAIDTASEKVSPPDPAFRSGLPDGIFSNKKSKFG
jgi:hypothetical protein